MELWEEFRCVDVVRLKRAKERWKVDRMMTTVDVDVYTWCIYMYRLYTYRLALSCCLVEEPDWSVSRVQFGCCRTDGGDGMAWLGLMVKLKMVM